MGLKYLEMLEKVSGVLICGLFLLKYNKNTKKVKPTFS